MARQWRQVSQEVAQQHPLYGIKNWLAVFAFGVLLIPLRELGGLNGGAHDAGMTLTQFLAHNEAFGTYAKAVLAFQTLMTVVIFWLLFTKQRSFRAVTSGILLAYWPVILLFALVSRAQGVGGAIGLGLIPWVLWCVVWVTYLQRSRRVRITFENCVVAEAQEPQSSQNQQRPVEEQSGELRQPHAVLQTNRVVPPPAVASASHPEAFEKPRFIVAESTRPTDSVEPKNEESLWAIGLEELEGTQRRAGLWAKVFSEAAGNEALAKALYLKTRAQQLVDEEKQRLAEYAFQKNSGAVLAQIEADATKLRVNNLGEQFSRTGILSLLEIQFLIANLAESSHLASVVDRLRGNTLLHLCAESDLLEEVKELLRYGASPAQPNGRGQRPAFLTQNQAVRQLLL